MIERINAFKLMELPYLAEKLKEGNYDLVMEHLKQSELEIVHKINEIVDVINDLEKKENVSNT